MIRLFFINIIFFSIILANESRSLLYSTGTPNSNDGYTITENFSVANRVQIPDIDYGMEYFKFTLSKESEVANVIFQIHEDNNNQPGNVLGNWNFSLTDEVASGREYIIYTFADCIDFQANGYYWFSMKAADTDTIAKWFYSDDATYIHSISNDGQSTWGLDLMGYAGNVKIYAEGYYYPEPILGDMNQDYNLNIQDIILMVDYILENTYLNNEVLSYADINNDYYLDIVDIILGIQIILNPESMPVFNLVDFNPNSDFFNQSIGPETFSNEVSCYYFGKQG